MMGNMISPDEMMWVGLLVAFGIGLGCGSYSTMPFYRLPNGESCAGKWVGKRSHCTSCDHQLRTIDLLPVFNWLHTGGKCHFCGAKIDPVYFFIEASITLISMLTMLVVGVHQLQLYIILLGLGCCLVISAATDMRYHTVPKAVMVVMVLFGVMYRPLVDGQIYDMVLSFSFSVLMTLAFVSLREKLVKDAETRWDRMQLLALSGLWLSELALYEYFAMVALGCAVLWAVGREINDKNPPYALIIAVALLVQLWRSFL